MSYFHYFTIVCTDGAPAIGWRLYEQNFEAEQPDSHSTEEENEEIHVTPRAVLPRTARLSTGTVFRAATSSSAGVLGKRRRVVSVR